MSKKIKVTQQQRDNALEALHVMWPSVPPENVYPRLGDWSSDCDIEPSCGTVACFGGWCAWWPSFRAQGVRASIVGAPSLGKPGKPGSWSEDASQFLFGFGDMFVSRGCPNFPGDRESSLSDHEIVTRRLEWLIENSEVVA